MFKTEQFVEWPISEKASQPSNLIHSYYNQEVATIEQVESYIRNTMNIMSQPNSCYSTCPSTYEQIVKQYPNYLRSQIEHFKKQSKNTDFNKDYI